MVQVKDDEMFLTVPIKKALGMELDKAKWAAQMPRAEIVRRVLQMFTLLPLADQVKWLQNYEGKNPIQLKRKSR